MCAMGKIHSQACQSDQQLRPLLLMLPGLLGLLLLAIETPRLCLSTLCLAPLQVLHLELDTSSSSMQYAPGDSIGVLPQNDPALVAALLERLGLEGGAVFAVAPAGEGQATAAGAAAASSLVPVAKGATSSAWVNRHAWSAEPFGPR